MKHARTWHAMVHALGCMALACSLLFAGGCGQPDAPAAAGSATSAASGKTWVSFPNPPLAALPADTATDGDRMPQDAMAVRYLAGGGHDYITYHLKPSGVFGVCSSEDDAPSAGYDITTSIDDIEEILVVQTPSDTWVALIVGAAVTGGIPQGRLEVYVDSNGDGMVTASDLTSTISDSGYPPATGSRWLDSVFVEGELYVLDSRNHRVLRIEDTNSDGIPDTRSSTVFLDSTQTHFLENVASLGYDASDLSLKLSTEGDSDWAENESAIYVRDTDADGRADTYAFMATVHPIDDEAPEFAIEPMDGDASVKIIGPASSTFEVWRTDENGVPISQLGTGVHAAGAYESTIAVSPLLDEAWHVVVKDVTNARESEPFAVLEAAPDFQGAAPASLISTTGGTVTVTGRNLTSGITATYVSSFENPEPVAIVPVTFVSSTELQVVVPALIDAESGTGWVMFYDGSQLLGTIGITLTR